MIDRWKAGLKPEDIVPANEHFLRGHLQPIEELHPLIRKEVESIMAKNAMPLSILKICEKPSQDKDWSKAEKWYMEKITADQFENEIRSVSGSSMQTLIYKGIEFISHQERRGAHYGNAAKAFSDACQNIIRHEPGSRLAKLIERELESAGLLTELHPVAQA